VPHQIGVVTFIYTSLFAIQCVFFLYRPITGKYLDTAAFILFAYARVVSLCLPWLLRRNALCEQLHCS
jgi:hypothetical protein